MTEMFVQLNEIEEMCALMGTTLKTNVKVAKLRLLMEEIENDLQSELAQLHNVIDNTIRCINTLFKLLGTESNIYSMENVEAKYANIQTKYKVLLAKRNKLLKRYFSRLQEISPNLNIYQWLNMQNFNQLSKYVMENESKLPVIHTKEKPTIIIGTNMQKVEHLFAKTPNKLTYSIYKPAHNCSSVRRINEKTRTPLKLNTTPYIYVSKPPATPLEKLLSPINLGIFPVKPEIGTIVSDAKACRAAETIDSNIQNFELINSPDSFLLTPIKISSPFPINTPTNTKLFRRSINLK